MYRKFLPFELGLIIALIFSAPPVFATQMAPERIGAVRACGQLALRDDPDVIILSARPMPASSNPSLQFPGRAVPAASLLGRATVTVPAYCWVQGYIRPAIHFDIRLPLQEWNGKFYMVGCAGLCGRLGSPEQSLGLIAGVSRGYAVATTDGGHWGTSNLDGRWALNNSVAREDYAVRSVHETAQVAEQLIRALYHGSARHSYFEGCSNGGRQALVEASRFPQDFDGVIAGSPAVNFLAAAASFTWIAQADRDSRGAPIFDPHKLQLVQWAVQKACADETGLIADPAACHFDPATLLCPKGTDGARCLTTAEVGVLRRWYSAPTLSSGKQLAPAGVPYGSEPFWASPAGVLAGQKVLAADFLEYLLPPLGKSYSVATFDIERDLPALAAQAEAYQPSADLTAFKARGGKIILYHGLADSWLPAQGTVNYFKAVEQALGGERSTRDTARLFLIPGWDHCGIGGFAPNPGPDLGLFGYAGLGALPALERWVQDGIPPSRLTATKYGEGHKVLWARPLCPYPQQARYASAGDRAKASNWVCSDPPTAPRPIASMGEPWTNPKLSPDLRAAALVKAMTLDEKIQMLHGSLGWIRQGDGSSHGSLGGEGYVPGIPRLGIPALQLIDGTLGVTNLGRRSGGQATAMPSTLSLAASFDPDLAYEFGALVGREAREQGFNVLLGGGVNIEREPRNGRNFEYLGEDPLLAGNLVAAELRGVQAQGVVATVKHYALNTQETDRFGIGVTIDERSMREVDLLPFEIAVRRSGVGAVMCAYNRVNGVYACENDYLLNKVLKTEWQFRGWVMSDWGATHSTAKAANAGLDQEFPANQFFASKLREAVQRDEVSAARVDDMVHRILRTMFAVGVIDNPPVPRHVDAGGDLAVAEEAAERGIVLLRNPASELPLDTARVKTIALIGRHADKGVVSGGGSSQVDPLGGKLVDPPSDAHDPVAVLFARTWDLSSPLQAIKAKAPAARIRYASGEDPADAARLAAASDVAIVFAYDSRREGLDTPSLSLPDGQDALIERVAAANRHTIVVLETGGPCLTPWADKVAALLEAWYPGNRGGQAIAAVLFGDVNPSGKLPVTFPKREADLPRASIVGFPDPAGADMGRVPPRLLDVALSEGVRVGYKWFDSRSESPQFPFGYGLSYTSFGYSNLRVASGKPLLEVSFNVSNTGSRAGSEIAEVYARLPAATDEPRRLVGWARVALKEREIKGVVVPIDPLALSTWDVAAQRWQVPRGRYEFYVGGSSRELPLHAIWNRS